MSGPGAIRSQASARPPATRGASVFAAVLILSPLLQWAYLTVLSQFTVLESPFTQSSGLVLAMQLFFAPGNVLAVVLGVGLMRRSEWMRRIARFVFLLMLGLAALQVGMQVAAWRFSSNTLLGVTTLIVAAVYFWYFGRPHVRQQFQARRRPASRQPVAAGVADAAPGRDTNPRALTSAHAWRSCSASRRSR